MVVLSLILSFHEKVTRNGACKRTKSSHGWARLERGEAMITTGRTDLREEWRKLAPAWIREAREGPNATRNGLLDRPMLEACGDVRGLNVLDCGCGEGRFCRMLLDRGARLAVGVDLCPPLITAAAQLGTGRDGYVLADVQDMGFLRDGAFDLAVSYLNQCDLPDFEANTREVFRVLKPGGRFVVANLHPMRSAVGGWLRAEDGSKLHVILDRYFGEGGRRWKMLGNDFTNFHRTLSTYTRAYRQSGFAVEAIVEPTPDAGDLERYPELDDEQRVPNFIVFVLEKPANA
jgi:SAM-dependent methyltransferase